MKWAEKHWRLVAWCIGGPIALALVATLGSLWWLGILAAGLVALAIHRPVYVEIGREERLALRQLRKDMRQFNRAAKQTKKEKTK